MSQQSRAFIEKIEASLEGEFAQIRKLRRQKQADVLEAFREEGVAAHYFNPSLGYGYDDVGRDGLDRVFARALGAEDALVRPQFASGTHVIACCMAALSRPGATFLSITGQPYDTLLQVLGLHGEEGSLARWGVAYKEVALGENGIDLDAAGRALQEEKDICVVYLQRSRGYAWRRSLSVEDIGAAIRYVKKVRPDVRVLVDNCYGEFVQRLEPCAVGADLMAGSLIKNPGGGLAPTGGYCAGKKACVEAVANRLFAPGIGREEGSYAASYRPYYQGLFMAPHVVAEARMGALLVSTAFRKLGYKALPDGADGGDLIASVELGSAEALKRFCRAVQHAAPVDAMAVPEPWDMPGYADPVIMAAGAFVQGASIELSADAPMREPYIVYMQGGLTLDHVAIALEEVLDAFVAGGLACLPE
nr:methionine gamma-lyase family protein [bacterium]